MKSLSRILLLALLAASVFRLAGQEEAGGRRIVDFQADRMSSLKVGDSTALVLVGNVVFYHNGAIITCDSAVRFNDKHMECYKNVVINKGTTYAYGDRADYNGMINTARIYAPIIKIVDKDATMYCYDFSFNTKTSIGYYGSTATMTQKDSRFESVRGYYNTKTRELTGVERVQMRNPDYQIISDSVTYNLNTEITRFYTRSYIWDKDGKILSSDRGWRDNKNQRYLFFSEAYIMTKDQELWADSIDYLSATEKAVLNNNVQIRDDDQKTLAFGDRGLYWGDREHAILTRRPSVISFDPEQKEDSLFVRSDSMVMYTMDKDFAAKQDSLLGGAHNGEEEIVEKPAAPVDSLALAAAKEKPKAAVRTGTKSFREWLRELFGGKKAKAAAEAAKGAADAGADSTKLKTPADSLGAGAETNMGKVLSGAGGAALADSLARAHGGLLPPDSLGKGAGAGEAGIPADSLAAAASLPTVADSTEKIMRGAEEKLDQYGRQLHAAGGTGQVAGATLVAGVPGAAGDGVVEEEPTAGPITSAGPGAAGASGADSTAIKPSVPPPPRPEDIKPKSLNPDSIVRTIKAYYNVKAFRTDFQAVCDSLVSFSLDSTIHLYKEPVMWNGSNQITADIMDIFTENQQIKRAVFNGDPLMSSEVLPGDTTHYNQVKGKAMESFFRDNQVFRTDVNGNGQTYYYFIDDKSGGLQGMLVLECANITFYMVDKQIDKIVYKGDPTYTIFPMDMIPETQELKMPGFRWEADRRPALKDVFDRNIRPSVREQYMAMPKPLFPITDQIETNRDNLIRTGVWRDRNDRISQDVYDFIRSLGYSNAP